MRNDQPAVGKTVTFGTDFHADRPAEWIVLKLNEEGHTALIAAKESAGNVPYHEDGGQHVTWKDCSLRAWLNRFYFAAFSAREQAAVRLNSTLISDDGDETVEDHVFILSEKEAGELFSSDEERVLLTDSEWNRVVHMVDGLRNASTWWLRGNAVYDRENNSLKAPVCGYDGSLVYYKSTDSGMTGVRPCMWVLQSALKEKEEPGLERLNIRLLEKTRDSLIMLDEGREESRDILAEFIDDDSKKRYVILQSWGVPLVMEEKLEYADRPVEKKARELRGLLSRRPYHEVMALLQYKADERKILNSVMRQAWTSEAELCCPEIDDSGKFLIRLGRYGGDDLLWRVIMRRQNKVFCMSEKGLFSDIFMDDGYDYYTWEDSRIRQWLNGEFYEESFSEDEKKQIVRVQTEKEKMKASPVYDHVFLMSAEEVNCLLPSPEDRKLSGTPDDVSLTRKLGLSTREGDDWWLRTPGLERESFCCVTPEGEIDRQGAWAPSIVCAIRPAIVLELDGNRIEFKKREA